MTEMPFGLSFDSDFFFGNEDDASKSKHPRSVRQALASLPSKVWNEFCREILKTEPEYVDLDTAILHVQQVDTCSNLDSPVEVWLDEDGYYRIQVYDR